MAAAGIDPPAASAASPLPPGFRDTIVLSGLRQPTAVRFAPDGRIFVAEKSGLIKTFDGLGDPSPTIFADLRTAVHNFWDRGLLGLAIDPTFGETPFVYVSYTHDAPPGGQAPRWGQPGVSSDPCPSPPGPTRDGCVVSGRVSRLPAGGETAGPEQVLVEDWCQQFPSHTMGAIAFGPDGSLYASGGDGASFNGADHGQLGGSEGSPTPVNPCGDPIDAGGSLRSQDYRATGDPVGYNGAIIRIDRATGEAVPQRLTAAGGTIPSDPGAERVAAYGFRNPFRLAFRPGTAELWVADVGWRHFEEIERITRPAATPVEDFGWPCMEGSARLAAFDVLDLPICEELYASGEARAPWFAYRHGRPISDADACAATDGAAISGLAFGAGASYPARYRGGLFVADYARACIWHMPAGPDGLPDRSRAASFHADAAGPVDLQTGPDGDLFYVDLLGGNVRRITYSNPVRYLSDVEPMAATNGLGPIERDRSNGGEAAGDGGQITLASVTFRKGLGVHALSRATFDVTGCDRFRARIGVDDEVGDLGSVVFAVAVDGSRRFVSPVMTGASPTATIDLDLTGARTLKLAVTGAGDGVADDHADWAGARVWCDHRIGPPLFGAATSYGVDARPHAIVAADVDGDGDRDLVTANAYADRVDLLLGAGDGTFGAPVGWAVGDRPKAVAVADVDGDGTVDLVSADQDSATVSVLLGAGGGTFEAATSFPSCAGAHDIAAADLDGDADVDLAVACWRADGVAIHHGAGDGRFPDVSFRRLGDHSLSVVIRDLDLDGIPDLAVTNRGSDTVSILLGGADGTLGAAAHLPVANQPHGLRAGDLDDDGVPDLVTANDGADSVSVLLGRGGGAFEPARHYPAGEVPKSVAIADLDGDGHQDVVASNVGVNGDDVPDRPNGDRVTVLLGDGTGVLRHGGVYVVGVAPWSVALADLDGDGWSDLATADWQSDTVTVLTNALEGQAPANDAAPVPVIVTPTTGASWAVGDTISFEGRASDPDDGTLAGDALHWDVVLHHCGDGCHAHVIESFEGPSGSFVAPDHPYPSHLELRLVATDSAGGSALRSVTLPPETASVELHTDPAGLALSIDGTSITAPYSTVGIVGGAVSVGAPASQVRDDVTYAFVSWSDGGARRHELVVPEAGIVLTATYAEASPTAARGLRAPMR